MTAARPFVERVVCDATMRTPDDAADVTGRPPRPTATGRRPIGARSRRLPCSSPSSPSPALPIAARRRPIRLRRRSTFDIDPASLPAVSIDDEVAGLSAELATPAGAQDLAAALAFNLQVEAEAMVDRRCEPAARGRPRAAARGRCGPRSSGRGRHRRRRADLQVRHAAPVDRLSGRLPERRQRRVGGDRHGHAIVTYSPDGEHVSVTEEPFDMMFSLRKITSGRWLTTDTPHVSRPSEALDRCHCRLDTPGPSTTVTQQDHI